jgi:hypothetical protein
MKALTRFGALTLAAVLAGCSTDGSGSDPAADPVMDRDVALQVGDAAAQDIELMGASAGPLGLGGVATESDQHGPFRCRTHERPFLTVVRTCTFKDAAGATQSEYDPTTTASAAVHVEISGAISREHWSAEVNRTRDLVATGLAGQETTRTWNGTGSGSATRERHNDEGESRQYDVAGSFTITNVVIPVRGSGEIWPQSGTVAKQATVTVTGGPNDGKTRELTVTVTFNGTRFVPITVNGQEYTFDLWRRRIVRDGNDD